MKKRSFHKPGKLACWVLVLDLCLTTLFGVALLVSFLHEMEFGDPHNYTQYTAGLDYIFAGIVLSLASFVAVEVVHTDARTKE